MNQSSHFDTKHTRTLDDLRRNICMAQPGEDLVLHETALTAQYGMSRTPIRQILQRLAYERLVETRSGVGTVVVALQEAQRKRDTLTHKGILQAALLQDLPDLSIAEHSDILALGGIASMVGEDDRGLQYDVKSRLHGLLSGLIPDPILQDAFSASYWRMVRWHMRDLAVDATAATGRLRAFIERIAAYEARNSRDLVSRIVEGDSVGL